MITPHTVNWSSKGQSGQSASADAAASVHVAAVLPGCPLAGAAPREGVRLRVGVVAVLAPGTMTHQVELARVAPRCPQYIGGGAQRDPR